MPPAPFVTPRRFSFEAATVFALAATAVLAAVVVIPVASFPFLYTKVFVIGAGALVGLACYILARLSRGNVVLPPPLLFGALFLPFAAYVLSTLFSGVLPALALFGTGLEPDTLGFVTFATLLAALAALALRRVEHLRFFLTALAWGAGALLAIEFVILVLGNALPNLVSPSAAIVGSPVDLSILAGLVLVLTLLTLRLRSLAAPLTNALRALGVLALVFLVLGNARLVWIVVALFSAGLFVEAVMRRVPLHEGDLEGASVLSEGEDTSVPGGSERPLTAPLIVLAVALFFLFGTNIANALDSTLHYNVLDVRPSWRATLSVGREVYRTSPLFGSGPSTFGVDWLKHRDASLNQSIFWNTDFSSGIGFIPTSAVTTGAVGAVLWLLFLLAFLGVGVRTLTTRLPRDPFARYAAIASFIGALYLFALATIALPGPVPLALAFLFAGVFASTVRFSKGQWGVLFARSPKVGFVIVFGFTLLLVATVFGTYVFLERSIAYVLYAHAAAQANSGALDAARTNLTRALSFAPTAPAYRLEAQVERAAIDRIENDTTLAPKDAQQKFQTALSNGVAAARAATALAPADYQNWLALASLYGAVVPLGVPGSYDNAKSAYATAFALNPTSPAIPYLEAGLEIAHKDAPAAEARLTEAIRLKNNYTSAILLLSQLKVADGKVKEALDAALAALYFAPNDPTILFQAGVLSAANGDFAGAVEVLARAVAANPSYANARYFLAAILAREKRYADALAQLKEVAALSADNAKAVAPLVLGLEAGKNPFPANLLSAPPPVSP